MLRSEMYNIMKQKMTTPTSQHVFTAVHIQADTVTHAQTHTLQWSQLGSRTARNCQVGTYIHTHTCGFFAKKTLCVGENRPEARACVTNELRPAAEVEDNHRGGSSSRCLATELWTRIADVYIVVVESIAISCPASTHALVH
jgi:hypothetical protein